MKGSSLLGLRRSVRMTNYIRWYSITIASVGQVRAGCNLRPKLLICCTPNRQRITGNSDLLGLALPAREGSNSIWQVGGIRVCSITLGGMLGRPILKCRLNLTNEHCT